MAFAANDDTIVSHFNNTGINVQTHTNQKQDCQTAGGTSGLGIGPGGGGFRDHDFGDPCNANSMDHVDQSGGLLHK